MSAELIHDRGRGPEIVGTRITVYNLLPYFLDATATEELIGRVHELSPAQVAAARAYVLSHPDEVLAQHLKIEARIAAGNPPEVIEEAKRTQALFLKFRDWQAQHETHAQRATIEAQDQEPAEREARLATRLPTFEQWLAEQPNQSVRSEGS